MTVFTLFQCIQIKKINFDRMFKTYQSAPICKYISYYQLFVILFDFNLILQLIQVHLQATKHKRHDWFLYDNVYDTSNMRVNVIFLGECKKICF